MKISNKTSKNRGQGAIGFQFLLIACCLLPVLFSCNNPEQGKTGSETNPASGKTQKVEVVKPQQRSFTGEVLITGTALPNQIVKLYATESGYVTAMLKDVGDKVRKGEVIARLSNPIVAQILNEAEANVQSAQSDILTATANLEAAKADVQYKSSIAEKLRSVYQKTPALTAIEMVEKAEGEALIAKANEQKGKANLQAAEQALASAKKKLELAQVRYQQLTVVAPFSGVITKRLVDNGALVQSGMEASNPQAIVEIQETNPIRLTLPVPETDAVGIRKGMDVAVSFPELSGKTINAKVSRMAGALDPQSKTMHVEIDLDNADGKILTGMYAKALMQIGSRANILSLPVIAKVRYKNEDYVLAVENNIVKRLPVKIGLSDKDYFEILNSEITNETQVIVEGKGLVQPEQIVEPILKAEE